MALRQTRGKQFRIKAACSDAPLKRADGVENAEQMSPGGKNLRFCLFFLLTNRSFCDIK
jgi:hypothetical protein